MADSGNVKLNVYQKTGISYSRVPTNGDNRFDANGYNAVTFYNIGTAMARIDKIVPLAPNTWITFDGNLGEHMTNIFLFDFITAGTQNVIVIIKEYR